MSRKDPLFQEQEDENTSPEQRERAERKELEKRYGDFGELVFPTDATAPILTPSVRGALQQWLIEMNMADALKRVGLKPRRRALLSGPPGCGKTTLAHHVAARVGLPMVVVQSGELISSAIGKTGNNLARMFREARQDKGKVALFFDEFDSMANKRRGSSQAADVEFNNITIALLQEIDRYDGMMFAATNQAKEIDPAIWRRFQMQIEIGFPGAAERFAIVRLYMQPFTVADETVDVLADAFDGASPALIREGCEAIKRALVLQSKLKLSCELPALLARFVASAAPAEGMPIPTLWEDFDDCAERCAGVPWPPEPPQ